MVFLDWQSFPQGPFVTIQKKDYDRQFIKQYTLLVEANESAII